LEEANCVRLRPVVKKINIPGESRVTVENNRLAPDDHILDPVLLEQPDELQEIARKRGRVYLPARCQSRTSGGFGP
jgi:hypothetical protein